MKSSKGFSLIELLIVVAIILIIAAIAIPNLMRSKITANEASAVSSLRSINTAEATYQTTYPLVGFSCTLTALGFGSGTVSSTSAGLLDSSLSSGTKSGYSFNSISACTSTNGIVGTYSWGAAPLAPGQTGARYFCTTQSFTVQFSATDTATCPANGSPIQ